MSSLLAVSTLLLALPATATPPPQGVDGMRRPPPRGHRPARPPAPKVGEQAPDFTLQVLNSTDRITLSSFAGERPVALVFGSYT